MRRSPSSGAIGAVGGASVARAIALAGLAGLLPACGSQGAAPAAPPAQACIAGRDVVLASAADVARFAACTAARSVTIRSAAALEVSALRALAVIDGDLVIGPTVAVEEIRLGALRSVGGAIRVVGNGVLQRLQLPAIERAGRVAIDGNPAVTTIGLPRLIAVHGALRITDNAALEIADLSALTEIAGELVVSGAPALTLLEADRLQRAASVHIDAPKLAVDIADRLRAIPGR